MTTIELPIERLIVDSTVHARSSIQSKTVRRYQQVLQSGEELPPVVGFQDTPDGPCWLADGFHRYYAARREGRASIPVETRPGGQREAYLHACGANAQHGLPRTRNDRWRSIVAAMHVPELAEKDDTWLAKNCCVSRTLVHQVRQDCRDEHTLAEAFRRRTRKAGCQAKKSPAQRRLPATPPEASSAAAPAATPAIDPTERLIARAFRAVRTAGQALAAAEKVYPEAGRTEATIELMEARNLLEDQLTPEERAKLGLPVVEVEKVREAQRAMRELWEKETKAQPRTKPAATHAARGEARGEASPPSLPSGSLPPAGRAGEGVRRLSNLPSGSNNLEQSVPSRFYLQQSAPLNPNLEQSAPPFQPAAQRAATQPTRGAATPPSLPSGSLPPAGRAGEGVGRVSNLPPGSTNLEQSAPEVQPPTKRADEAGIHR